jgi:hypothetical protein
MLPIAFPLPRNWMASSSGNDGCELFAIADPAAVFAPVHFRRIGREIRPGDVVMGSDFRAAQAAKKKLSAIVR